MNYHNMTDEELRNHVFMEGNELEKELLRRWDNTIDELICLQQDIDDGYYGN